MNGGQRIEVGYDGVDGPFTARIVAVDFLDAWPCEYKASLTCDGATLINAGHRYFRAEEAKRDMEEKVAFFAAPLGAGITSGITAPEIP